MGGSVSERPLRLTIRSAAAPNPLLLRAAIAARLAGRPFPSRAEDEVGARVAEVARARLADRRRTWR